MRSVQFDFALTSPPYYDTEIYTDEETNSLNRYKTFDDWCNGFYFPLVEKTMTVLRDDAVFILNIGDRRYPLSKLLQDTFGKRYRVKQVPGRISGQPGLRPEGGEKFYEVSKR